ncbi:MAG: DUF2817 domain-containing protein [Burkholderiales bacterium]|nr:DUF2817 domain-containing protein [Burkholderiales bacterium]
MTQGFPDSADYSLVRDRFLNAAQAAGAALSTHSHPLPGPAGETLRTDVAWLGDPRARRVLFIISGTHGVEGYYGSTCQSNWLQQLKGRPLPGDVAVMMVHLINPWGAAWCRRVTEDNVDLNRNYVDFAAGPPRNEGYEGLHEIYTCRDLDGPERRRADALLEKAVATHGWRGLHDITGAGQYAHADGLFYGGREPSWSRRTLQRIVEQHLGHAEAAIGFDLHTGAGEFGHPMLMAIAQAPYPALEPARSIFGPWLYTLFTGKGRSSDTGVAAGATGYTSQALLDALPRTALLQLVIECGTYDPVAMHRSLRDDHWLHLHGPHADPADPVTRAIKRELFERFLPADGDWREIAWRRSWHAFERALAALPTLAPPQPR